MTRPCNSVHHHFAFAASSGVSVPALSASTAWSQNTLAMSTSVAISARVKRECWKEPTGWPNATRSLTYSRVHASAGRAEGGVRGGGEGGVLEGAAGLAERDALFDVLERPRERGASRGDRGERDRQ